MLTPIELQGKVFKTGFGYDKKDVESFLKDIMKDYEILYKENLELTDKINVLSEGVQYYKSIEKTLQKALVLAQKAAADTEAAATAKAQSIEATANQNAQNIEQNAYLNAEKITSEALQAAKEIQLEARRELDRIQLDISTLVKQYNQYSIQYKQLINAQLELLNSEAFHIDFSSFDKLVSKQEETEKEEIAVAEITKEQDASENEMSSDNEQVEASIEEENVAQEEIPGMEEVAVAVEPIETEEVNEDSNDDMPVIDLNTILAESDRIEKEYHKVTETEEKKEEKLNDLSEEELLDKLFASSDDKSSKKSKVATNTGDDFEFLDL